MPPCLEHCFSPHSTHCGTLLLLLFFCEDTCDLSLEGVDSDTPGMHVCLQQPIRIKTTNWGGGGGVATDWRGYLPSSCRQMILRPRPSSYVASMNQRFSIAPLVPIQFENRRRVLYAVQVLVKTTQRPRPGDPRVIRDSLSPTHFFTQGRCYLTMPCHPSPELLAVEPTSVC